MSDAKSYAEPVEVGDVMVGGTVCEVEASRHPVVRAGRLRAVLLRLADPCAQRRLTGCAGSTRPSYPSRRRSACSACPASRRTPGCWRSASRSPARRSSSRPRPARSGRRSARSREIKGARAVGHRRRRRTSAGRCSTSSGSTSRVDHRSPTFADGPGGRRAGRHRRVLRERRRARGAARSFKRMNLYGRVPVCGLVADYNATSAPEGPDRLPGVHGPGAAPRA